MLAGAKDKLGLRVHGLIVGSPEKKRADPAVLRALCTARLPNGKSEVLVTEFGGWASVQVRPIPEAVGIGVGEICCIRKHGTLRGTAA